MCPDRILATYDRVADDWDRHRDRTLFERRWLDRFLDHAPGRRILDIGCGSGRPIAQYLSERRAKLTGVDGAERMVELFKANLPEAKAVLADMRGLALNNRFDGILAWDSFFHLSPEDQRAMFPVFAAHAAPKAALMFTSGPQESVEIGQVHGEEVYHSSFAPKDYEAMLADSGFRVLNYVPEDPSCAGHTVWLARFTA
jgi:SAM-dependent methyltransferase